MKETVYTSHIDKTGKFKGMVITDLDGTLLDSERKLSDENRAALVTLGKTGFVRVIATGRHFHSFSTAASAMADESFPADYVIVSSGAGIFDLKKKRYIRIVTMDEHEVGSAIQAFASLSLDFAVHRPIPDNHHFSYYFFNSRNEDFIRRIGYYKKYTRQWKKIPRYLPKACQVIAIISTSENHRQRFEEVCSRLGSATVIRTTSPLDHSSLWIEVFPREVSKGQTAAWLAARFGLDPDRVCAFGNDYNDIDMLAWAGNAFTVSNAPADMKEKFPAVPSCDESGFACGVKQWLELTGL